MQLPLAVAAAVMVAEAAVLVLRPRNGVLPPAGVDAGSYFTSEQVTRAKDFRSGQLALYGGRVAIELGVLVLVVTRPPGWLRRARRPVLAAAAAGAALSVGTAAAALPLSAVARQRAVGVGLVTQSWAGWAGDIAKSWAIGAVVAGAGGSVALVLVQRFPRDWWAPASAVIVAFAAASAYAAPVVLDPLFNTFKDLPAGRTRSDVLELARRAGVDVGSVKVMDASRRTTAANAYVTGLGRTKRVVLYDTLLDDFTPDEVRLVVAHELGHVRYRDVPRGLLWLALVAPAATFAVAQLGRRFARGAHDTPLVVPALALSVSIVAPLVTTISNQLSRRVEARADTFSLELTDAPEPFIGFERRIVVKNVGDPDPPRWQTWLLGTHPPTVERIGIAVRYSERRESERSRPRSERPQA